MFMGNRGCVVDDQENVLRHHKTNLVWARDRRWVTSRGVCDQSGGPDGPTRHKPPDWWVSGLVRGSSANIAAARARPRPRRVPDHDVVDDDLVHPSDGAERVQDRAPRTLLEEAGSEVTSATPVTQESRADR